jgi:hypothetical protein
MLASTVAPSELPSSPADPVVSLRAAVERGRTPPAAVAERPGSPLAGKRAVEESGNGVCVCVCVMGGRGTIGDHGIVTRVF